MSINGLQKRFQSSSTAAELNQSPFDNIRQQMEDVLGNGGVMKEVVHPGEGPSVPQNASVLIHYSGFLEYSDQPFETTTHFKHPRMMKLGRDVTLPGMELGLLTMRKGEFSRFLLHPRYAYGKMGCPPLIPAAAPVLFEIQILDILDSGQVDDFVILSPVWRSTVSSTNFPWLTSFGFQEEQNMFPLCKLDEVVNTLRSFGNRCFNQSRYEKAKEHYKQGVELLGNRVRLSDAEAKKLQMALLPLYLNLSLTELRLERPRKALKYANRALDVDSSSTKALYRCGQAYLELGDNERAHDYLVKAQTRKPFDGDINNLLKTVTIAYKDSLDKEKDLYAKMFAGFKGSAEKQTNDDPSQ
ncbi:inactive peptidyl-prolyl cis-trans isomerase FKBP6 isoform X1 [Nerophis lumbriciformis]|uniref:inactive peptidyl-prolyl cis-trans isomerase FKBP6 isoform X1 n=1 Tax=Nerophis lumbriciformis TaxID=546530 RepID=UPI002ADF8B41|nr:inactive peptidyl-prolyl cis-trans isomerase FKBP6-like isoform X1 [Nerophis lumbriciformis]